jgi:hypothetical protein
MNTFKPYHTLICVSYSLPYLAAVPFNLTTDVERLAYWKIDYDTWCFIAT